MHQPFSLWLFLGVCLGIALTTSASAVQQPLTFVNASRYTFHHGAFLDNEEWKTAEIFETDVGVSHSLTFYATVWEDGVVVCREPLEPFSRPVAVPNDMLFSSSQYQHRWGELTPNTYPQANPFYFIGWYGGEVVISMTGYACTVYNPEPVTISATVTFRAAIVEVNLEASKCPTAAVIEHNYLSWGTKKDGCFISYTIMNHLSRSASFGAIQYLEVDDFYLIINNQKYSVDDTTGLPLLDSNNKKQIVRVSDVINAGEGDVLEFGDSPGLSLGRGCWRSPNAKGFYTSVGFTAVFRSFILQDWDTANPNDIAQTPIGGQSVVQWMNQAQADLVGGQWHISISNFEHPTVVPQANAYSPHWGGWSQDKFRSRGEIANDGCYKLNYDP